MDNVEIFRDILYEIKKAEDDELNEKMYKIDDKLN
jgi:hypothetical protein